MKPRKQPLYLPNGAYSEAHSINETANAEGDQGVVDGLLDVMQHAQCRTVGDFGCGYGWYVARLNRGGAKAQGFDDSPKIAARTGHRVLQADLSVPLAKTLQYDLVIALDCGCYIPAARTATFIKNCCTAATKAVAIAWRDDDSVPTPLSHEKLVEAMKIHGFVESVILSKLISRKAKRKNRHRIKVFVRASER